MNSTIRDLYTQIMNFEGENLFGSVLKKWVIENDYQTQLSRISDKIHEDTVELSDEENWELYALSRVLDILTLHWLPDNQSDGSSWAGTGIELSPHQEIISGDIQYQENRLPLYS